MASLLDYNNTAAMDELAESGDDQFEALTPDEEASPEEEAALAIGLVKIREDIFGDTLPKIANVYHQDERELYEVIADMAMVQLKAAKDEIEEQTDQEAPASVFFSEGGLLQQCVEANFKLCQQLNIPGSQDPDQYAGAMMNTYTQVGKYLLEVGDEGAIKEATELGGQMVAEKEVGTTDLDEAQAVLQKRLKKQKLPEEISGILGGVV